MATRRSKKRSSSGNGGSETPEQMLDRVLGAFERWLSERTVDPDLVQEPADVVRTACELKGSVLGEPNPADWDPQLASQVVGEIFPGKVVGVDRQYAEGVVPAMLTLIDFLTETGRWKSHNDVDATRTALMALAPVLPDRFEDPGRLSMGGRVAQLAIDEGVDVSDPQALGAFMDRFNSMPFEWRKRLTDGPAAEDGDHPAVGGGVGAGHGFDDDDEQARLDDQEMVEALDAAVVVGARAVGFTGKRLSIPVPNAATELAALFGTPLLTRMIAYAEWVRPGRQVTSTGAMRRADTAEWAKRFGIGSGSGPAPNSMWDLPELAIPWQAAASLAVIDIAATKVYPGAEIDAFVSGDPAFRIRCGRDAVTLLIQDAVVGDHEPSDLDRAVIRLVLRVLASVCRPEGADLGQLKELAERDFDRATMSMSDAFSRIVFRMVLNIVEMLRLWGLISMAGTIATVPPGIRPAVALAITTPTAPLTFRLQPGAVPVEITRNA